MPACIPSPRTRTQTHLLHTRADLAGREAWGQVQVGARVGGDVHVAACHLRLLLLLQRQLPGSPASGSGAGHV